MSKRFKKPSAKIVLTSLFIGLVIVVVTGQLFHHRRVYENNFGGALFVTCPDVIGFNKVTETRYGYPMTIYKINDGACRTPPNQWYPLGFIADMAIYSLVAFCLLRFAGRMQ